MGPESPLAAAAQRDAAGLVRAIFAPEAERFAPRDLSNPTLGMAQADIEKGTRQGEHLGLILIAVEALARDVVKQPELVQAKTDNEVLEKIQNEVTARYQELAQRKLDAQASETQQLGGFGEAEEQVLASDD